MLIAIARLGNCDVSKDSCHIIMYRGIARLGNCDVSEDKVHIIMQ